MRRSQNQNHLSLCSFAAKHLQIDASIGCCALHQILSESGL